METLRFADLHPAYATASAEESALMANLGAAVYGLVRERLHASWSAVLGTEDTVKADLWRTEGRMAALEEVKSRLVEAEKLSARLVAAEGAAEALHAGVEAEVVRRLTRDLEGARKDYDLVKAGEMAVLKEALAKADGQSTAYAMLVEAHESMKGRIADLEEELSGHKAAATKSSHAIGKQGEATIWEMIESSVLTDFAYAEAKNMSGVSHAADFHLWVMSPTGKRIKMLIDSKKYKRAVNSDEINKLCADVDADDEAHAGMLISLVSPIFTKKQFEIRNSLKQKPILYMSFCDVGEDFHSQLLCNGIRALIAVVSEMKEENRSDIIQQFDEVIAEVTKATKEIDNVIKAQVKTIDSLRQIKASLIDKIAVQPTVHQQVKLEEDGDNVIEHTGACIVTIKVTGKPCGKPVWAGGVKCKLHTTRKVREAISGAGAGGSAGELSGEP